MESEETSNKNEINEIAIIYDYNKIKNIIIDFDDKERLKN